MPPLQVVVVTSTVVLVDDVVVVTFDHAHLFPTAAAENSDIWP
jgi:hypothetical protein